MKEIEVGEYIRTDEGIIDKVIKIDKKIIVKKMDFWEKYLKLLLL